MAALRDPDGLLRAAAARAIGAIGVAAAGALPDLMEATRVPGDALAQVEAATALVRLGGAPGQWLAPLRAGLKAADVAARRRAAEALGEAGPAAAPAAGDLRKLEKDADASVRAAAGAALQRIGGR